MKVKVQAIEQRLMSVHSAATYTSLSYSEVYLAVQSGAIPAYRLLSPRADGKMIKRILIERSDLDRWIDNNKERY